MKQAILVLAIAVLFLCAGCAVFNRDNTPTVNLVEERLIPAENPARTLSYPVMIPVGLVAVIIDCVIVHPVTVADDAFGDTTDALWDCFEWDTEYVTECGSLVPRTLLTPIVFTGCFLGRSTFDIPPHM